MLFALSAVDPHDPHIAARTECFARFMQKDDAIAIIAVRVVRLEITILTGIWDRYSAHGDLPKFILARYPGPSTTHVSIGMFA